MTSRACITFGLGAAAFAGLYAAAGMAAGQTVAAPPTTTVVRPLEVPRVNVDVAVADREGNPIRDLTAADFEVFEDGQPVEVSNFAVVGAEGGAIDPAVNGGDVVLGIYIDDTSLDQQFRTPMLAQLEDFVGRELPPNVSTMLVRFDGRLHFESDLGDSAAARAAAVDRVRSLPSLDNSREGEAILRRMQTEAGRPRVQASSGVQVFGEGGGAPATISDPGAVRSEAMAFLPDISQYARSRHIRHRASLEGMQRFLSFLGAVPGRKVVLWAGGLELRTGENLYRSWQTLFPEVAVQYGGGSMVESLQYDVTDELQAVLELANNERIALFPLAALTGGARDGSVSNARTLDSGGRAGRQTHRDEESSDSVLAMMSESTGGRRIHGPARLDEQLTRMAADLSSYYSLAYRPPTPGDGEYHKIEVRVQRDGAVVFHREGYRDSSPTPGLAERTVAAALLGAGSNPLGVSISLQQQEPRDDGTCMVPVAVGVPLGGLVLLPEGEQHAAHISVLSAVRDGRGGISEVHERGYPIEIDNDELFAAVEQDATFVLGMVLRPGPHRIAVSVRDDNSAVESTVFLDLEVGVTAGDSTE